MPNSSVRIISLLPSTTEIVAGLGMGDKLVGRSHECDVPQKVTDLPACTEPKFNPEGQSYELDQRVKALLQEGLSIYRVDADQLRQLRPDVIITQDHCEVCAASVDEVTAAAREVLGADVSVVSVSPTTLAGVYQSIQTIAKALDVTTAGDRLVTQMKQEFDAVRTHTQSAGAVSMMTIEWLEPLMTAGNWVPELAEIAGGITPASTSGSHSPYISWHDIVTHNPEVLCIMPCGYSIAQTNSEMHTLSKKDEWQQLQAVRNNRVYLADGHHYFNRPGPRLTHSARILAEVLHPELEPTFEGRGWVLFSTTATTAPKTASSA